MNWKQKLFIIVLAIVLMGAQMLLFSCESKPFKGYVVGKEYIEGHMCHDENYKHIKQAVVVVPHVQPQHHHEWQESEFILHVANSYDLRHIHVDSLLYHKTKIGENLTFY